MSPTTTPSSGATPSPEPTDSSTSTSTFTATRVGPSLPTTGIAVMQTVQLGLLVLLLGALLTVAGRRPRATAR